MSPMELSVSYYDWLNGLIESYANVIEYRISNMKKTKNNFKNIKGKCARRWRENKNSVL